MDRFHREGEMEGWGGGGGGGRNGVPTKYPVSSTQKLHSELEPFISLVHFHEKIWHNKTQIEYSYSDRQTGKHTHIIIC